MKRVRYAVGALGAAPVLGLALAAPVAKAAVQPDAGNGKPATPAKTGKTVRVTNFRCTSTQCTNSNSRMYVSDDFRSGGRYVSYQEALLVNHVPGLEERVRYYSFSGKELRQVYIHGHYVSFSGALKTMFHSSPDIRGASTIWIALVKSKSHSKVVTGPLELGA